MEFPTGQYRVILADPPWKFRVWRDNPYDGRSAAQHYAVMSTEDIHALPVASLAAPDCALFCWVTSPNLEEGIATLEAWGFTYKTVAFTWIKMNPSGQGIRMGLGYWTRSATELCLLATRGAPRRVSKQVHQVVVAPTRRHSEKPQEVHQRIVALMGDVPRIELFARRQQEGWGAWGNEVAAPTNDQLPLF